MKSKFPFSLENIPKQESFVCLSLKFGSVLSGLILILYSVFALAQCMAVLNGLQQISSDVDNTLAYSLVAVAALAHITTLFLSTLMVIGALGEKTKFMRPWIIWTTVQVTMSVLMLVFWSVMSVVNQTVDNSLLFYIIEFLILMIRFYMLMLVSSFYKQIEDGETERLQKLINNESWYNSA